MTFLYIISHPKGWIKVGRAVNPAGRLCQHQHRAADALKGEFVFPCAEPIQAERRALIGLSGHRITGEWFHADIETACAVLTRVTGSPPQPFPEPRPPRPSYECDTSPFVPLTGEQMRLARYFLGWSQTDLGEAANLSRATMSRIEEPREGMPPPTEKALKAISSVVEAHGLIIFDEDEAGGVGVRLPKRGATA